MRTTLRLHPKMDSYIGQPEVQSAIDSLIRGAPVDSIPSEIKSQVLTGLNVRRKDAIIRRNDALSSKLDIIISEITRGPAPFSVDGDINVNRTFGIKTKNDGRDSSMHQTTKKLINGETKIADIDAHSRHSVGPFLKGDRVLEISRANYGKSHDIDRQMTQCHEYSVDSRRLAPKLQKVAQIEKRLEAARRRYEEIRASCFKKRKEYNELERAESAELERKLQNEMVEYGSHIPTSLPLEYQKFSSKVLDARMKEQMGAKLGMYDDASANRKLAVQLEREELSKNSENFGRAFLRNKEVIIKSQQQKREGFKEVWRRKKEKMISQLTSEIEQSRKAVENLEKELAYAKSVEYSEISRIRCESSQGRKIPSSLESFKYN